MTIEKGEPWGRTGLTPFDVVVAPDEESASRAIRGGARHVQLMSGNLLRAFGSIDQTAPVSPGTPALLLPCDSMEVTIGDGEPFLAIGSVVIGSRCQPIAWLATGGFLGELNVSPRAHPNDGVIDVLEFAERIGLRQQFTIRRRMRLGDHLPHPALTMLRQSDYEWQHRLSHGRGSRVVVDGREYGRARRVHVRVRADAFVLCMPLPAHR